MRLVFMGTPDFAAVSLAALLEAGYEVSGVFTQPDKPKGRGNKLAFSPVKELALSHNLAVFQPSKMRDGTALETLKSLSPDLLAVVAYGRILPEELLAVPKLGCVNIHASLLPKYRGSAPIQRAILCGERETGVTSMFMVPELDAGDIIFSEKTEIGEFETAGELFARLAPMGAALLVRTLAAIERGEAPQIPQKREEATFAPPLDKRLCPIDWDREPRQIVKQICALQPWPLATAELGGVACKIFTAEYTDTHTLAPPGSLVAADKRGIELACCGGQTLRITELQAPGKKRMSAASYLLGHPLEVWHG